MKLGLDGFAIPGRPRDPFGVLAFVHEQGLAGSFFGSLLALSPTLDAGFLGEVRQYADALGLSLEIGVGNANPARFDRFPAVLALGEGDYRVGFERQIRAARAIGCRELRIDLGGEASRFDRRISWAEQLAATSRFLRDLAPLCRDLDCRLDLETHADITTFELVRLIEEIGPEVLGVCLDTANVLCRAEDPVAAARRVAPYVHQTHVKDAILYVVADGLARQSRPCGEGIVDWHQVLPILARHSPDLTLSIEDHRGIFGLAIYDPVWQALHPDLRAGELAELIRLARGFEERVARGETLAPAEYEAIPWEEVALSRLQTSIQHLREVIAAHQL